MKQKTKQEGLGLKHIFVMFLITINTCYVLPRLEEKYLQRLVAFALMIYVTYEIYSFLKRLLPRFQK
jgi:hypothetical protein